MKHFFCKLGYIISFPSHCFSVAGEWIYLHADDYLFLVDFLCWILMSIGFAGTMHPLAGFWHFVGWVVVAFLLGGLLGMAAMIPFWFIVWVFHVLGFLDSLYYTCRNALDEEEARSRKQSRAYEKAFKESFTSSQADSSSQPHASASQTYSRPTPDLDAIIAQHSTNTACHIRFK